MILTNGAGVRLWDFAEREILAVYGIVGNGKTAFLRHVALSWAETGMVKVVVGTRYPQEWDDMRDIVHTASPEAAVEYGRLMSRFPWENVVCVIDDADRAYTGPLLGPRSYGTAWTFASHRPLSDSDKMVNLAVGQQSERDLQLGFGDDARLLPDRTQPGVHRAGSVVRAEDDGSLREYRLATDLVTGMPDRIAAAPLKMPLPTLPKRLWY